MLFDIDNRKFYFFDLVLWPQDTIYLVLLMILGALALFPVHAIAGRLWCGYACPQTVYTEIFLWFEKLIEGDRPQRIKLDAAPWSARKLALKSAKHATWGLFSPVDGITFVGYFVPIRELMHDLIGLSLGAWSAFWMVFYAFATYGNAGFLREQMCRQICPCARFQFVMLDPDTLIIAYDTVRGESRGRAPGQRPARTRPRRLWTAASASRSVRPGSISATACRTSVHRLRSLYRCMRPGHGQDELSARPDPLLHGKRGQHALHAAGDTASRRPTRVIIYTAIPDPAHGCHRLVARHRIPLGSIS